MATYVLTNSLQVNTTGGEWGKVRFKNRYKSSHDSATAQSEFDRRQKNRRPTALWRWENYKLTLVAHCHIKKDLDRLKTIEP